MFTIKPLRTTDLEFQKIGTGETLLVLQRNAQTTLDQSRGESLVRSVKNDAESAIDTMLKRLVAQYTAAERETLDFLVVASNPWLGIDGVEHTQSQRSVITARALLASLRSLVDRDMISKSQILNNTASHEQDVVEITEIKGTRSFNDTPELFEYFTNQSRKTGEDIYDLYSKEAYKDDRDNKGVEDSHSMAVRLHQFISFSRTSSNFHAKNKGRRLVFLAVSHFDTITPLLVKILKHPSVCSELIPVDYLGGITFVIDQNQICRVFVKDRELATNLNYSLVTG